MCLDIVRTVLDDLIKLHDGEVLVVVLRVVQRLIVALDIVRTDSEDRRLALDLIEIMIRDVILWEQVHTDDPLHERIRGLTTLEKDQPQQISCILLILIKGQRLLQQLGGATQIAQTCTLESQIIVAVCDLLQHYVILHLALSSFLCLMASSMRLVMMSFISVRSTFAIASSI